MLFGDWRAARSMRIFWSSRNLKLGVCHVDKGKAFTVGSGNDEMVLGFIGVFNPARWKRRDIWLYFTKLKI
ncbi:hypothetical protein EYF80_029212 [Liparis tanakae]|uniref:Uncharacterized protein n=1 Tax=Liparis tanakae TaxID=230148 RepID=A0A4Z2H4Q7_9TELE|nr:hypothetical protein EYF80_029212 [Liparis tanakae]